jgi:TonB family protein
MIARTFLVGAVLLTLACSNVSAQSGTLQHEGMHAVQTVRLCSALESVTAGERRPITVSGVFIVGPEHQMLYDANEPSCKADVQSATWIEFAPGVTNNELDRLVQKSRRAYVTFTGELYGPGAIGPDDTKLPPVIAYANRIAGRRYGHLSAFRTKLVVSAISDVRAVPESLSSEVTWHRPSAAMPIVERADVPRYPDLARNAGIDGVVTIEVTVSGGEVTSADVKSGDRMLSGEAVANVKTWRFATSTNATLITTYTYELEQRRSGTSELPRIDLELPARVHIVAAANGW